MIEGKQPKPEDYAHHAHCFDLLRQALLCAGDTTVEGLTEYGEGWGAVHKCKDMSAIKAWTEGHAGLEWHKYPDRL